MKKLLLIILCIALCACAKAAAWEDVSEKYAQAEQAAINPAADAETFLASDYKKIIYTIFDDLNSLEKTDEEILLRIYGNAATLKLLAAQYDNDQASQIKALGDKSMELVKAYYEKGSDKETLMQEIRDQADMILGWSDDEWAAVEKRKLITWAEVQSEYEALKEETIANMTKRKEVSEIELEELNAIIVKNAEVIKDGINDANKDAADEMYKAAVTLKEYTEDLKNDNCQKVADFADDAITYILRLYGGEVADDDYDFLSRLSSAAKWSLNLWNEVTTQLKR